MKLKNSGLKISKQPNKTADKKENENNNKKADKAAGKKENENKKADKKPKDKKKKLEAKKRKRERSQSSSERGRSKEKKKQKQQKGTKSKTRQKAKSTKPANKKKKGKKQKKPESRDSSLSTPSRGRPPKRRAGSDESTLSRTTSRERGSTLSRGSSLSDLESVGRPWKKKKDRKSPILYSCCGFCSLGAGSLLTALIYLGLCVGFFVYRIGELRLRMEDDKNVLWSGDNLLLDIWKILLVVGIVVTGISSMGALTLLIASCIWGQKEHYKKIKYSVIIFGVVTGFAIVFNVGEALYATLIPSKVEINNPHQASSIVINRPAHKYDIIKSTLKTSWALTGVQAAGYIYLMIVLVSYLRLLKYKSAPKVGILPDQLSDEETSLPSNAALNAARNESRRPRPLRRRHPSTQSGLSAETERSGATSNNTAYMNWPATNEAYVDDSVVETSSSFKADDDTQTATSSFYDMPPGNIYDETPYNDDQLPTIPKRDDMMMQSSRNEPRNARAHDRDFPSMLRQDQKPMKSSQLKPKVPHSQTSSRTSITTAQQSNLKNKQSEPEKPDLPPEAVSSFFKRLNTNEQPSSFQVERSNPMEEMFRLFGSDLCSKHPENCERYLKSYKDIRSKTSHITSPRDVYEFEGLMPKPGPAKPPVNQHAETFALNSGPYSMNSYSTYGAPSTAIPHHQSISTERPEPIYGFRPQTRDKNYPRYPPMNNSRQRTWEHENPNGYPSSYPYRGQQYAGYYGPESVYYDEACSTCYGDYGYGDYGSYYGYRDNGYPPPPVEPPPVYTPTPPQPPRYDPQMQQFSAMSDIRRPRSKASNATWFPINPNDDYSTYLPSEEYAISNRTHSMPNLGAGPLMSRHSSLLSDDFDSRRPLCPEITIPSPREARRISRSSSFTNAAPNNDSRPKPLSRTGRSQSMRNYKGYHSGDLRRKTSHTDDRVSRSGRMSRRNSERSRPMSRNSLPPQLPPRDATASFYEELGSVYSVFDDPPSRRPSLRSRPSHQSGASSFHNSLRASESRGSNRDQYPDKHIRRQQDENPRRKSILSREEFDGAIKGRGTDDRDFGASLRRQTSRSRSHDARNESRPRRERSRSRENWDRDDAPMERGRSTRRRDRDFEDFERLPRKPRSVSRGGGGRRESSRSRERKSQSQDRRPRRNDEEFHEPHLGRSKSLRYTKDSSDRRSNKQVKFGSTPNLHHI